MTQGFEGQNNGTATNFVNYYINECSEITISDSMKFRSFSYGYMSLLLTSFSTTILGIYSNTQRILCFERITLILVSIL